MGPILAAIPATLVAGTQSGSAVAWTVGAYLLIHQAEGNLLAPVIQERMLAIPPGVILLGIITVSIAFGGAGLIFAAPLSVITFVLIKKVYLRDTLGEATALPGEPEGAARQSQGATADSAGRS